MDGCLCIMCAFSTPGRGGYKSGNTNIILDQDPFTGNILISMTSCALFWERQSRQRPKANVWALPIIITFLNSYFEKIFLGTFRCSRNYFNIYCCSFGWGVYAKLSHADMFFWNNGQCFNSLFVFFLKFIIYLSAEYIQSTPTRTNYFFRQTT